MVSCEFCEISKNAFFTKHLWATASGNWFSHLHWILIQPHERSFFIRENNVSVNLPSTGIFTEIFKDVFFIFYRIQKNCAEMFLYLCTEYFYDIFLYSCTEYFYDAVKNPVQNLWIMASLTKQEAVLFMQTAKIIRQFVTIFRYFL